MAKTHQTSVPTSETIQPHVPSPWIVHAVTSVALFATFLDTTVLYFAFPSIQKSFPSVSEADLSWVLNGFTIVFGAVLLPAGRLADHFGRKKMFLLGCGIFTVSSVLCGLAVTPRMLIAFRLIQAVGGAFLIPASLSLVLAAFPQSKRAVAVTTWGAVGGLAASTGPSLGAAMIQGFGWPAVFYLNLPVGLIAFFLGLRILTESKDLRDSRVPSPIGVVLAILAMGLLTFAIVHSGKTSWLDPVTMGSLLFGISAFLFFVWHSHISSAPVLDLKLFKISNFRLANAAGFIFYAGFSAMYFSNVLFLTQVWKYPTFKAGLAMTPAPLLIIPLSILSGRVAAKIGHRPILIAGALCFAAAGLWQWFGLTANPSYLAQWLPATLMTGIGLGLTISTLGSASAHDLPPTRFGIGGAVNGAVRQLGGSAGVALAFALLGRDTRLAGVVEFKHIFLLMIMSGLVSAVLASGINTKLKVQREPEFSTPRTV